MIHLESLRGVIPQKLVVCYDHSRHDRIKNVEFRRKKVEKGTIRKNCCRQQRVVFFDKINDIGEA